MQGFLLHGQMKRACLVMYFYKKPIEQKLRVVSYFTCLSNSHCPRLKCLTVVQVQRSAPWGRAALSSIHVQVCSRSDGFSAEL